MNTTGHEHLSTPVSELAAGAIVVGVDGSEAAADALAWATGQAVLTRRPICLVSAWKPVSNVWLAQAGIDPGPIEEEVRKAAEGLLDDAEATVAEVSPSVEVHRVVHGEDPRSLMLALSREAHMIVVGSRGLGPVKSLVLGSVSASLARHAACPVVVLRPRTEPVDTEHPRGVLVAVDGTERSRPAAEVAFEQAAARGLPLTVLHCLPWDRGASGQKMDVHDPTVADVAAMVAGSVAGLAEKHPDVPVGTALVGGLPDEEVLRAARGRDLVVVGHRRTGLIDSVVLGSVSLAVLEHAEGAVMVVPG
ncbi:universal stress protein [Nocardioides bruguierae]|uniref:Universal stress protein n=1 Tax=Nocardioides bruguierae TaxID=2945102 RepID=A0A9X2D6M1_9ACTN|nr:universal stress protein [Nocardioides bruguierae]MCM0619999.1 universal stress protein [Nocardioides bruguierae]